jgi:deazaflavin-dependent oxidoreductase (nitroreductase family)
VRIGAGGNGPTRGALTTILTTTLTTAPRATTTGKVSGQRRQTPLTFHREGDRLFIIGSNFGQEMHPAWSSNLLADPEAWVTISGKEIPVLATLLVDAERERVSAMLADYSPTVYRYYTGRTDREMRIFALTKR